MTDQELLERAAKAAGLKGYEYLDTPFWSGMERTNPPDEHGFPQMSLYWNPLTDDRDALRLAVQLGMVVYTRGHEHVGALVVGADRNSVSEPYGEDIYAATRRAIVRAAAMIEAGDDV